MYRTAGAEEGKVVFFSRSLEIPRSAMAWLQPTAACELFSLVLANRMRPPNNPSLQRWAPKRNSLGSDPFLALNRLRNSTATTIYYSNRLICDLGLWQAAEFLHFVKNNRRLPERLNGMGAPNSQLI
jgi:hypothetical protein